MIQLFVPIRLKSLLGKTKEGRSKRLGAKIFIFAVGEGAAPGETDLQGFFFFFFLGVQWCLFTSLSGY